MARCQQLVAVVEELHRAEVGPVVGKLLHLTSQVRLVEVLAGVPHTYKI